MDAVVVSSVAAGDDVWKQVVRLVRSMVTGRRHIHRDLRAGVFRRRHAVRSLGFVVLSFDGVGGMLLCDSASGDFILRGQGFDAQRTASAPPSRRRRSSGLRFRSSLVSDLGIRGP